jgi:hypothetical protein
MDTADLDARDRAGIAACSKLIRQALEQTTDTSDVDRTPSLNEIHPCIEKESLRLAGITAPDSVLDVMVRWPRLKFNTLLKYRQLLIATHGIQAPISELVDRLSITLGKVYWAARNCALREELVAIDRTIRPELDALYGEELASLPRESTEPRIESAITKERLMAIDLSQNDGLVTYPADRNWPLERKKILFLQTAVRLGFDYSSKVVPMTRPFFGQTLNEPFEPVVVPSEIADPFSPPPFDIARQTPQQWVTQANQEWEKYRDGIVHQISEWRRPLIERGELKEFDRPRKSSGIAGQKKVAIVDEHTAFEWAARYFFSDDSWADIAKRYPLPTQQRAKRRDQVRKRATAILGDLGLPVRK